MRDGARLRGGVDLMGAARLQVAERRAVARWVGLMGAARLQVAERRAVAGWGRPGIIRGLRVIMARARTVALAQRTHVPRGIPTRKVPCMDSYFQKILEGEESAHTFGSLGRLADEVWDAELGSDGAEVLDRFLGWVESRGIDLWPHQEDALMNLMAGDHVILGTPTGSGKSLVALGMHFLALCDDKTSFYTAPIKALVSEKFFQLEEVFGRQYVGMITGDTSINPTAPIICCTAEILANQALREGAESDVSYVAMDEFHYYGDPDRGWAWQVPLLTLPNCQFLLMSATLGDTSAIAESLQERTGVQVDVIDDAPRPVPLSYEYVDTSLEATVELAMNKGAAPIYVVHFSQDEALASAQALASFGITTKEQREAIKQASKGTSFSSAFGKILQRLLSCGIGVHHAGMLPRYRLLVEKLAQQGLLPVICGTDTLGVGINVPIHTVILTQLTKFDGTKMRRLNPREFHQIAGRAGRSGFDTEGLVIAEAPEHEIENAKLKRKAAGDPKKLKKLKLKKPPERFVAWNEKTFTTLIEARPPALKPHLRITHSMVLAEISQGGDAKARVAALIDDSLQTDEQKLNLHARAAEVFATLIAAGVVVEETADDGSLQHTLTVDLPDDFALDQPLSPFLLASLELLDPESDTYALDAVSMVEATMEDPRQILRAQERRARDKAWAEMKAEGVDHDSMVEEIAEVTYPKPLEDLLEGAFDLYCKSVPWARDYALSPKSILREMIEKGDTFKSYVASYGIARSEGLLLRYLSETYRSLDKTIPLDKRNDQLKDIIAWLSVVVRSVDSSLVDEWEGAGVTEDAEPLVLAGSVVTDRRGLTVLVRNALFTRVKLAAADDAESLGDLDADWGFGYRRWREALDAYYDLYDEILTDADARNASYFHIDEADEKEKHLWHVLQIVKDPEDTREFRMVADVDLDATQDGGDVVFTSFAAGFFDDLAQ